MMSFNTEEQDLDNFHIAYSPRHKTYFMTIVDEADISHYAVHYDEKRRTFVFATQTHFMQSKEYRPLSFTLQSTKDSRCFKAHISTRTPSISKHRANQGSVYIYSSYFTQRLVEDQSSLRKINKRLERTISEASDQHMQAVQRISELEEILTGSSTEHLKPRVAEEPRLRRRRNESFYDKVLKEQRNALQMEQQSLRQETEDLRKRCSSITGANHMLNQEIQKLNSENKSLHVQIQHLDKEIQRYKQLQQDKDALAKRTKTGTVLNSNLPLPDDVKISWESIVSDILLEPIVTLQVNPVTDITDFLYSVQDAAYQIVHDKEVQCLRAMGYEWSEDQPMIRTVRRQLQDSYDIWKVKLMDYNEAQEIRMMAPESIRESVEDILALFAAGQLSDPKIQLENQDGPVLPDGKGIKARSMQWLDQRPSDDVNGEDIHLVIPGLMRGDHLMTQKFYFWDPKYQPLGDGYGGPPVEVYEE